MTHTTSSPLCFTAPTAAFFTRTTPSIRSSSFVSSRTSSVSPSKLPSTRVVATLASSSSGVRPSSKPPSSSPSPPPPSSFSTESSPPSGNPRDECYKELQSFAEMMDDVHLRALLQDEERCKAMIAKHGTFIYDYSRQRLTIPARDALLKLAESCNLPARIKDQCTGVKVNKTEDRAALHVALRAERSAVIEVDGVNVVPSVHVVLDQIRSFSESVRLGKFVGSTGKTLTSVLAIGIGGSYLGPRFVAEAMRMYPTAYSAAKDRTLRFLANVDPVDVSLALEGLDPETTLCIVVSKSFSTPETMLNARTMRAWIVEKLGYDAVSKHMVAVSTNVKGVMDFGIDAVKNMFRFSDWVGGRYSVCSAVGILPLAIHYGFDVATQFLAGARDMDKHYMTAPLEKNLPVLMGLIGVWNSTFLKYNNRALLPYQQALVSLAPHVQQVDMESNGKRVKNDGTLLDGEAGPINFGEPGTNGQHSFYQLLHQGRVVPCDFVGVTKSQTPLKVPGEKVSNHDELMCNFFAQPDALAIGKTAAEVREAEPELSEELVAHKVFPGNRPSSSLLIKNLSPYEVGQLLALFEHRTTVEGFIWDINSFDQWGVELGKVLAKNIRDEIIEYRAGGEESKLKGSFNASTKMLLEEFLKKEQ